MSKLKQVKSTPHTTTNKTSFIEEDKKDQAVFVKWMIGVTLLLIVVIYFIFTRAVG